MVHQSSTHRLLLASALLTAAFASGCRTHVGFRKQFEQLRPTIAKGDWAQAAQTVQKSKGEVYAEEDRVMYWLNLGTLLHYAGRYDLSMQNFVEAEKTIQDLWTKSVSAEASKFLVSETIQDYPGEDFEKTLLYFYTALNRVKQGKLSDALVEARRADEFLKKIQVQYEKEKEEVGTLYKQDAFMLWLVGLFYEIEGSWSDAFLAYQTSFRAYAKEYVKFGASAPSFLREDLIRTAQLAGRSDAVEEYSRKFGGGGATLKSAAAGMAEVILIHAAGEAPYKQQTFIQGRMPDNKIIRVALPKFVASKHRIRAAEMRVAGATAKTELMEPVTRIALDNYKHRLPAITARAIARAVIKYTATTTAEKAVKGDGGDSKRAILGALIGLAGNVASAVSEQADLRGWTMLPAEIGVTRLWVPAGAHTVDVEFYGANGASGRRAQFSVDLAEGERKILSVRTLR